MNVGDVVVLKAHGGPEMVIEKIGKAIGRQPVTCVWFAGTKKNRANFDARVLQRADSDG